MKDIETRSDIDELLQAFYVVAIADAEIGHHFDDLDLASHLPVIVDFWEKVLFGTPVYFGNPMAVHKRLHEKLPLKREHFLRWVAIFEQTVDGLFEGEMADNAKLRARSIADSLDKQLNGPAELHRIS